MLPKADEKPAGPVLTFGGGTCVLDPLTGAPVQFHHPDSPGRHFLLDQASTPWHSVEHQWGSGHLVTDRGAARWHAPDRLKAREDGVEVVHNLLSGVRVEVRRGTNGQTLRERYAVINTASEAVTITGLGIQTPFADLYHGAERSLRHAVHAHLFTGGTWAWALAQPMSGRGRSLGLIVREGALRAYAVESRNKNSLSNARGHLVLLVTDHARNPGAFGGQPALLLDPGHSTVLEWELGWHASVDDFLASTRPPARLSAYAAKIGEPIVVDAAAAVRSPDPGVTITADGAGSYHVRAARHDTYALDIGEGARTEVLFHLPLREP